MATSRIKINCNSCEHLIVTITHKRGTLTLSNDVEIEGPEPDRRAAGMVLIVCPQCRGKMEVPEADFL